MLAPGLLLRASHPWFASCSETEHLKILRILSLSGSIPKTLLLDPSTVSSPVFSLGVMRNPVHLLNGQLNCPPGLARAQHTSHYFWETDTQMGEEGVAGATVLQTGDG